MAYISFQPSDFFNALLYTGTGASNAVTGVGFQPDMVWIKNRTASGDHSLQDAVRGTTKTIIPNGNDEEQTYTNGLTAFGADGFTVGSQAIFNGDTNKIVSWNWKAGTTSGLSGGTLTPTAYSINTTSGFGIYQYTGTGSVATIAHGLGVAPECVIVKRTDTGGNNWAVYHASNTADPASEVLALNTDAVTDDDVNNWNDTKPDATVFTIKSDTKVNGSGNTYIAYCFAPIKGYSKFGSYIGNNSTDGPVCYTGFRPAMIIRKRSLGSTEDWAILDNKRLGYNPNNAYLFPNEPQAESDLERIDFNSNGFKLRTTDDGDNASAGTYLYMAFAEFPIVSSNSKAGTAR